MNSIEIKALILSEFKAVYGVIPENNDINLLRFIYDNQMNATNLIYVFSALEDKLGLPVSKILKSRPYTFMSVEGIVQAICNDFC